MPARKSGAGFEGAALTYIAYHPDATKYQIAKNVSTARHLDGIPYSTLSEWIQRLEERGDVVSKKLGKSRAGLEKIGYRITPSALFWMSYELDLDELMRFVRQFRRSLPVSPELIEKTIKSTGADADIVKLVSDLKKPDRLSMEQHVDGLIMCGLWDLEFDDEAVRSEFVHAILRGISKANPRLADRRELHKSLDLIIQDESRYLANASKTMAVIKDEAEVLWEKQR